jgi:hypothetical protein
MFAHRWIAITAVTLAFIGCKPKKFVSESLTGETSVSVKHAAKYENLEYSKEFLIHHDEAGRVEVKVDSAWADDNLLVLRAEFKPDDSAFHLYGSELPRSGVNGVGRPTLLEVSKPQEFHEIGKLASSKDPILKVNDILNLIYPVYPDGTVILYLPLRVKDVPRTNLSIPIKLTYMSCSEKTCNVPIESAEETIDVLVRNRD